MKDNQEEKKKENIQRVISVAAHEYFVEKTKYLNEFKELSEQEFAIDKSNSKCTKTSNEPLYKAERDFKRLKDDGEPDSEADSSYIHFEKDFSRIIHSLSFRRLQGKSQLIPAGENEFFRTRATHSIEVADIAKRIARRINSTHPYFQKPENNINLDLISCACLLHDIGHPPFGHSGEEILNQLMGEHGGFEGNAQTLRLISKLENRLGQGNKLKHYYRKPRGLNLTVRTLASILKYDEILKPEKEIRNKGAKEETIYKVRKGYYLNEKDLVDEVKEFLEPENEDKLKTIECQIMDIADDIAYSAYDLEDSMEADIVLPFDLISLYDEDIDKIVKDINKGIEKGSIRLSSAIKPVDALKTLASVFKTILEFEDDYDLDGGETHVSHDLIVYVARGYGESILHAKNPLVRRQFLETLIEDNIRGISVELNEKRPYLSKIQINEKRLMIIECLKKFNFHKVIATKKIQMAQHRSKRIIESIFEALYKDIDERKNYLLSDEQIQYFHYKEENYRNGKYTEEEFEGVKKRFVCDIIANLSDNEAVRLFNKLNGDGNFFEYSF